MPELELSEWLKGEDIGKEAQLRFSDEGKNTEIPQGEGAAPKKAFEIGVLLPDGTKKIWTMNMTSQRAVAQTYGKNTKEWINKIVTVFTQDENVRGTMRKTIYARVPAAAPSIIFTQDTLTKCGNCISFNEPADSPSCGECKYSAAVKGVSDNFMPRDDIRA